MSGRSNEVQFTLRELCSRGGLAPLTDLYDQLRRERCFMSEDDFCSMILRSPCFLLVRGPHEDGSGGGGALRAEDCAVVARTSLRLCGSHMSGQPCGNCGKLHLCKHFVYGTCRFGKGRKICKFSHDLRSEHNMLLLRENSLHLLPEPHLMLLLLQSDPQLLPKVCLHYNKGSCTFSSSCTKVHLCMHFLQGRCLFGRKCNKLHEVDEVARRHLQEERGLSRDIVCQLPAIYRNIQHLRAGEGSRNFPESRCDSPQTENSSTICLHFLRNSCRFHGACRQVHFLLPYRWQKFDGDTWTDLPDMETIERDFCDPSRSQSGGPWPVDFQTMTQDSWDVRRLSTVSSVLKPPHYTLTTEWRWFYKGDHGTWVEYGQMDEKQRSTSVTSESLEKVFLLDKTTKVKVVKGERMYVISFEDMYQRNLKHNTKRKIRRRPRFVSRAEVEQRLVKERIQVF